MKRLFALLTALILLCMCVPSAYADVSDGVFVPAFNTVMSTLFPALQTIDPDFADTFAEEYYIDGEWAAPQVSTVYYYDRHRNRIEFDLEERNGFVYSVDFTMPIKIMEDWETQYKSIMFAVATSLLPNADIDFEQALFECLYYDYVIDSPVSSVSMTNNFGVYRFTLEKNSGKLRYHVYLSID